MPEIERTDADWREALTPEQYEVLRRAGTERAWSGKYVNEHSDGTYHSRRAERSCSTRRPSTNPAVAGRASTRPRPRTQSNWWMTRVTAWFAPKFVAADAGRISVTCSRMGPHQPVSDTA